MEEALSALEPAGHDIDRDRLMFEAGRASARRIRWTWPTALAVLSVALVVSLGARPEPVIVERTVTVTVPQPIAKQEMVPLSPLPDAGTGDMSDLVAYAKLQQEVLARGVEALPEPRYSSRVGSDPLPSLDGLLGIPLRPRSGGFLGLFNYGGDS